MTGEQAWNKWNPLPPGPRFAALRRQMKAAFLAGVVWGRVNDTDIETSLLEAGEQRPKRKRVVRKRRT